MWGLWARRKKLSGRYIEEAASWQGEGSGRCPNNLMQGRGSHGSCGGTGPSFFKVFLPCHNSERLILPPAFMARYMTGKSYGFSCSLVGPSGNAWSVELLADETGAFFGNGWKDFALDHSLQAGNFLVFDYDGNSCFVVRMFDETMCERKEGYSARPSVASAVSLGRASMESQRQPVMKVKAEKALMDAISFKSENPCCVLVMRASDVYHGHRLTIPVVQSSHFREAGARLTLCGPSGDSWPVTCLRYRNNCFLTAGWHKFSRGNRLEADDACVFEFIKEGVVRVHIFRVVDEIMPKRS